MFDTPNYFVFGLYPLSGILKNTIFRKLDLCQFSVVGVGDILLRPLEGANPNYSISGLVIGVEQACVSHPFT
jgi:hypothetical protein